MDLKFCTNSFLLKNLFIGTADIVLIQHIAAIQMDRFKISCFIVNRIKITAQGSGTISKQIVQIGQWKSKIKIFIRNHFSLSSNLKSTESLFILNNVARKSVQTFSVACKPLSGWLATIFVIYNKLRTIHIYTKIVWIQCTELHDVVFHIII